MFLINMPMFSDENVSKKVSVNVGKSPLIIFICHDFLLLLPQLKINFIKIILKCLT